MEFDRLRRNWERLGRRDPLWAVLTDPSKAGGRWSEEEFFRTGEQFCRWLGEWIEACGESRPSGRALDFGCGVGRITQAMAPHFTHVTGVDLSEAMLEAARAHNRHGDRVDYVCNARLDLSQFADATFDFANLVLVLQHMRPEYACGYLREILRLLRPGGLMFVQAAVAPRDPATVQRQSVPEQPDEMRIEMHALPAVLVSATVSNAGGRVVAEGENELAGPHWHSMHFLARRT